MFQHQHQVGLSTNEAVVATLNFLSSTLSHFSSNFTLALVRGMLGKRFRVVFHFKLIQCVNIVVEDRLGLGLMIDTVKKFCFQT